MEYSNQLLGATSSSEGSRTKSKFSRWRYHRYDAQTNQLKHFHDQLELMYQAEPLVALKDPPKRKHGQSLQMEPNRKVMLPSLQPPLQHSPAQNEKSLLTKQITHQRVQTEVIDCSVRFQLPTIHNKQIDHLSKQANRLIDEMKRKKTPKHTIQHQLNLVKKSVEVATPIFESLEPHKLQEETRMILELLSPKHKFSPSKQFSYLQRGSYNNHIYHSKYKDQQLFLQMSSKISKNIASHIQV